MYFPNFHEAITHATAALMSRGIEVDAGSWQGVETKGKPDLVTLELMNLEFEVPIDAFHDEQGNLPKLSHPDEITPLLAKHINPNLPWADDHFAERVSRDPSNPGKEYLNWPWWRGQDRASMQGAGGFPIFTHTYQERFWPKYAGDNKRGRGAHGMRGLRYDLGDLDDVVSLLAANPYTRQATFPIFFPEDTGAVHGGRVPCTLHYHFLLRDGRLNIWYPIRSCDLVRHFRDDLYLACRLLIWVIQELQEKELRGDSPQLWVDVRPGTLFFTAYSFHVHKGDLHHVRH
jgi:hypothetical protein